jgi:hypothetical protein
VKTSVIRPGILVALKSTVSGGVTYARRDLPADESDGKAVARWETTRVIEDPDEHARATKARSKAVKEICGVCSRTSFGMLCPESSEADLDAAIARARTITASFNAAARFTRIEIYALKGRIASSDAEAARAIGQEVAAMIEGMNDAIDRLDPKAIRDAANRAREMSAMLSPELSTKVGTAIEAARKAARIIVKRVEDGGEPAAVVLADIQRGGIAAARMAFLDLDGDAPVVSAAPALPAVDVQRFAGLDVEDDAPVVVVPPAPPAAPVIESTEVM